MKNIISHLLAHLVCMIRGHDLESESIVNTICPGEYYLKHCRRCGMYYMHGEIGGVTITKNEAFRTRDAFYKEFPYMRLYDEDD